LADHVAAQPNPGSSLEIEAQTGCLRDGSRQAGGEAGRLEDHQERIAPPRKRRKTTEPLAESGTPSGAVASSVRRLARAAVDVAREPCLLSVAGALRARGRDAA
jgi:hypothetical protein